MGEYNRYTRECSLSDLNTEMIDALNHHIEMYNLGDVPADQLICIETISEKVKKGIFAGPGPKLVCAGVILTPEWLLEVIKADNAPAHARSARLEDIVATDYEKGVFNAMIPDHGIDVSGMFTDTTEKASSFIGLGKGVAGEKFKEMILKAVRDAKKIKRSGPREEA